MATLGAARNGDPHLCPQPLEGGGTHVGGLITASGTSRVFINQMAAAVEGDLCQCPVPGNTIKKGSTSVFFGSMAAARNQDGTSHNAGGAISGGSGNVFIGD